MYVGLRKVDKLCDWEQITATSFYNQIQRRTTTVNDRQTLHTPEKYSVVVVNLT
jgi:hypothetical protein